MSDLQDLIARTTIIAYNQGITDERQRWQSALKEVNITTEHGYDVVAIQDLIEVVDSKGRKAT